MTDDEENDPTDEEDYGHLPQTPENGKDKGRSKSFPPDPIEKQTKRKRSASELRRSPRLAKRRKIDDLENQTESNSNQDVEEFPEDTWTLFRLKDNHDKLHNLCTIIAFELEKENPRYSLRSAFSSVIFTSLKRFFLEPADHQRFKQRFEDSKLPDKFYCSNLVVFIYTYACIKIEQDFVIDLHYKKVSPSHLHKYLEKASHWIERNFQ